MADLMNYSCRVGKSCFWLSERRLLKSLLGITDFLRIFFLLRRRWGKHFWRFLHNLTFKNLSFISGWFSAGKIVNCESTNYRHAWKWKYSETSSFTESMCISKLPHSQHRSPARWDLMFLLHDTGAFLVVGTCTNRKGIIVRQDCSPRGCIFKGLGTKLGHTFKEAWQSTYLQHAKFENLAVL